MMPPCPHCKSTDYILMSDVNHQRKLHLNNGRLVQGRQLDDETFEIISDCCFNDWTEEQAINALTKQKEK